MDQFEPEQFVALIRNKVFNHYSRLKTQNEHMNCVNCAEKVVLCYWHKSEVGELKHSKNHFGPFLTEKKGWIVNVKKRFLYLCYA